jgi:hypothetical protein
VATPRHVAQGGTGSRVGGTSRGNGDIHAGATLPTLAQTVSVGRKPRRGHVASRALCKPSRASRPHARRGQTALGWGRVGPCWGYAGGTARAPGHAWARCATLDCAGAPRVRQTAPRHGELGQDAPGRGTRGDRAPRHAGRHGSAREPRARAGEGARGGAGPCRVGGTTAAPGRGEREILSIFSIIGFCV